MSEEPAPVEMPTIGSAQYRVGASASDQVPVTEFSLPGSARRLADIDGVRFFSFLIPMVYGLAVAAVLRDFVGANAGCRFGILRFERPLVRWGKLACPRHPDIYRMLASQLWTCPEPYWAMFSEHVVSSRIRTGNRLVGFPQGTIRIDDPVFAQTKALLQTPPPLVGIEYFGMQLSDRGVGILSFLEHGRPIAETCAVGGDGVMAKELKQEQTAPEDAPFAHWSTNAN